MWNDPKKTIIVPSNSRIWGVESLSVDVAYDSITRLFPSLQIV
jgi:hypothetical protein